MLEQKQAPRRLQLRLKAMKLAGFKSFVDPTTVQFPSQLLGVVGPNGCGKSNIIDAVRWVMGESSAKSLRAEAGVDVIFNGSLTRKPLGQAAIELIFDNPEGALLGEYAAYREIVIKRVVTRDGQSTYYLNQTRCRRKDITDLFLGTGMGARSYAIIEQGMISKLIDARPDDLRIYIEEAAGVSRYKERRKETENRMQSTRENLERLNDIRNELEKQLERLEKQAAAAKQFKTLKAEERRYQMQLVGLRWKKWANEKDSLERRLAQEALQIEEAVAIQHEIDLSIEKQHQQQDVAQQAFQDAQTKFYEANARITRIEQSIEYKKEQELQLKARISQQKEQQLQVQQQIHSETEALAAMQESLETQLPCLEDYLAQVEGAKTVQAEVDALYDGIEVQWDGLVTRATEASHQAQKWQLQIQHLEENARKTHEQIHNALEKKEKIEKELIDVQTDENQQILENLTAKALEANEQLSQIRQEITAQEQNVEKLEPRLFEKQTQLQQCLAQISALEALQAETLGEKNDSLNTWLSQAQLVSEKRLANEIEVEAAWEVAVELVLGSLLQAVRADNLSQLMTALEKEQPSIACAFTFPSVSTAATDEPVCALPRLLDKVRLPFVFTSLLDTVYTAETLLEAQQHLPQLPRQASIVTKDGLWLSHDSLRILLPSDPEDSLLRRERTLKALKVNLELYQQDVATFTRQIEQCKENREIARTQLEEQAAAAQALNEQIQQIKTETRVQQERLSHFSTQLLQIDEQLTVLQGMREEQQAELLLKKEAWQEALLEMDTAQTEKNAAQDKRQLYREKRLAARQAAERIAADLHAAQLEVSRLKTECAHKNEKKENLIAQLAREKIALEENITALLELEAPLKALQLELDTHLAEQITFDAHLATQRETLQIAQEKMKSLEQQRQAQLAHIERFKTAQQALLLQKQTCQVQLDTLTTEIQEQEWDIPTILSELPDNAAIPAWEASLNSLGARIKRLGAINLVAIEEYEESLQRKTYLDKQYADLNEALNLLTDAIAQIDQETKTQFKNTFDKVNMYFQTLFPKVFGGGSAGLYLSSDDLLSAGVAIKACPPGKKNSTIHLLSGGEKALTAIALVFSIFQLNPAPFCLLDEVDAPLDDANVGRYCQLIREMSEQVQFIFISHNKLAIEMAEHLVGVTMKEPGVSRIVTVDVERVMTMLEEAVV